MVLLPVVTCPRDSRAALWPTEDGHKIIHTWKVDVANLFASRSALFLSAASRLALSRSSSRAFITSCLLFHSGFCKCGQHRRPLAYGSRLLAETGQTQVCTPDVPVLHWEALRHQLIKSGWEVEEARRQGEGTRWQGEGMRWQGEGTM